MDHGDRGDTAQTRNGRLSDLVGKQLEDGERHGDTLETVQGVSQKQRRLGMVECPDGEVHIEGVVCITVMGQQGGSRAKQAQAKEGGAFPPQNGDLGGERVCTGFSSQCDQGRGTGTEPVTPERARPGMKTCAQYSEAQESELNFEPPRARSGVGRFGLRLGRLMLLAAPPDSDPKGHEASQEGELDQLIQTQLQSDGHVAEQRKGRESENSGIQGLSTRSIRNLIFLIHAVFMLRSVELCVEAETGSALRDKRISSVGGQVPHVGIANAFSRGERLCFGSTCIPTSGPAGAGGRVGSGLSREF